MLFKRDHIAMIKAGTKTQTRRLGRRRWKEGSVHRVTVGLYDKTPACYIRILGVHLEQLGDITEEDAQKEGYSSVATYRHAWERVYKAPWDDELECWVVDFCLVHKERFLQQTLFDSEGRPDQEGCLQQRRVIHRDHHRGTDRVGQPGRREP